MDFGANQNDADSVELDDWDVIGTWTFDDFDDGNASWNLSDFGMGIDSDVTLTIFDNEALNAETGANPASGMTGNNPTHENLDVVYDGIDVPYVVKDDYLYRVPDAAGTEMFFKSESEPGRYSVTIFEVALPTKIRRHGYGSAMTIRAMNLLALIREAIQGSAPTAPTRELPSYAGYR